MTDGEKGKPAGSTLTAAQLRALRRSEQRSSLGALGISSQFLGFPDLELAFINKKEMAMRLLTVVREFKPGAIISFYPESQPYGFGHPDHDVAGKLARLVSASADVTDFLSGSGATMEKRPELWLHTFDFNPYNPHLFGLAISPELKVWRNSHLVRHFVSQFSDATRNNWAATFDQMTDNEGLVEGVVWDSSWGVRKGEVSGIELYRRER